MRLLSLVFALTVAVPALAVPLQLTHQGRLNDSAGVPLVGTHQLTVSVYAGASGGSPLWTDTLSAELVGGVFSVVLGSSAAPLDSALFNGAVRWVGLAVDDGAELPQRLALVSVPYAVRAEAATVADGLSAPLAWDQIAGAPADEDTLGALACTDGQVPTWQGSDWLCASPTPATVDVSTLSGTIDVDNLPVGTSGETVAAGDHTHSFSQISGELGLGRTNGSLDLGSRTTGNLDVSRLTGDLPLSRTTGSLDVSRVSGDLPLSQTTGSLDVSRVSGNLPLSQTTGNLDIGRTTGNIPYGRLPVGTLANTVAAGNHTHTAADVGALPASGGIATGDIGAQGLVVVGHRDTTCNSSLEGALRWDESLEVCTGGAWATIWSRTPGSSSAMPGTSCAQVKTAVPGAADGVYWIRLNSGAIQQLYCDMTTDGGGWTLVRITNAGNPTGFYTSAAVSPSALTSPTAGSSAQLSASDANALGNILMAVNTQATVDSKLWFDKTKVSSAVNRQIAWTFDSSRPVNGTEYQASSVYPPSQNRWGQDVGASGTHVNYDSRHTLCFGSWTSSTKGHVCINRDQPDWWNYGTQAVMQSNASPRVAYFVK